MKLWLDDIRPAPNGWFWSPNAEDAMNILRAFREEITHMSFDHDLGDTSIPEKTGYTVALWMAEHEIWPTEECTVHSANPVGARRIQGVIDRYGPYDKPCRWTPVETIPNWAR